MALSKPLTIDVELEVGTDAYTAVDVVGGLLTFAVDSPTGGGILNSVMLIDEDNLSEPYKLYLFDAAPSTIADDAAFEPTIADMRKLVAVITLSSYTTINSIGYCYVGDINQVIGQLASGNLYGYMVPDATPDHTNADALYLRLGMLTEG